MDDFMKTEAKDIISTGIEKASGATGINIEVSINSSIKAITSPSKNYFSSSISVMELMNRCLLNLWI